MVGKSISKEADKYYFDYLLKTETFPRSIYHQAKHVITRDTVSRLPTGSRILDAGCGVGNVSAPYCQHYEVVGIDNQEVAINYCRKQYKGKYLVADLTKTLPFYKSYFDLILFHDSIEHFDKPMLVLKQLYRMLKKGGTILISTINYDNPLWFVLENTWHRLAGGDCRTYSKDVHPTRYTETLLRKHCNQFFKEISLDKKIVQMELFYIGTKN